MTKRALYVLLRDDGDVTSLPSLFPTCGEDDQVCPSRGEQVQSASGPGAAWPLPRWARACLAFPLSRSCGPQTWRSDLLGECLFVVDSSILDLHARILMPAQRRPVMCCQFLSTHGRQQGSGTGRRPLESGNLSAESDACWLSLSFSICDMGTITGRNSEEESPVLGARHSPGGEPAFHEYQEGPGLGASVSDSERQLATCTDGGAGSVPDPLI